MLEQQVFAKQALCELPLLRKLAGSLHGGMNPIDSAWAVRIFDAMARVGIVAHDFAGTAAAVGIDLEKDGVAVARHAHLICLNDLLEDQRIEEGREE